MAARQYANRAKGGVGTRAPAFDAGGRLCIDASITHFAGAHWPQIQYQVGYGCWLMVESGSGCARDRRPFRRRWAPNGGQVGRRERTALFASREGKAAARVSRSSRPNLRGAALKDRLRVWQRNCTSIAPMASNPGATAESAANVTMARSHTTAAIGIEARRPHAPMGAGLRLQAWRVQRRGAAICCARTLPLALTAASMLVGRA